MSDSIKAFGILLCTTAIMIAILSSVVPNKALGKTVRTIMGVYMSLVLITPFARGEIKFDISEYQTENSAFIEEQSYNYIDTVLEQTALNIKQALNEELIKNAIVSAEVFVSVNIDASNRIYCDKVAVSINNSESDKQALIDDIVYASCEIHPEITVN